MIKTLQNFSPLFCTHTLLSRLNSQNTDGNCTLGKKFQKTIFFPNVTMLWLKPSPKFSHFSALIPYFLHSQNTYATALWNDMTYLMHSRIEIFIFHVYFCYFYYFTILFPIISKSSPKEKFTDIHHKCPEDFHPCNLWECENYNSKREHSVVQCRVISLSLFNLFGIWLNHGS